MLEFADHIEVTPEMENWLDMCISHIQPNVDRNWKELDKVVADLQQYGTGFAEQVADDIGLLIKHKSLLDMLSVGLQSPEKNWLNLKTI